MRRKTVRTDLYIKLAKEGLPIADIANKCGVTRQAVHSALRIAKEKGIDVNYNKKLVPIDDDLNFKENNIINFLFTFDPVNDTEKTAVIKHKLIFSVYFYIFVSYPRFMTEWAKSVKDGVVYEIHPSLLASMLYAAMNDSMVEVTPHTFIYPNINDFNDAIGAIMDYCYDAVSDIDDSLSDIYYEYLDVISDNLKIKRKSVIK